MPAKSHFLLTFLSLLLMGAIGACSPYKKNIPSKVFHNTTAHYNAYFIAQEKINEVEEQIARNYKWNYNKILPIFPQFDTTDAKGFSALTEDAIKKSSISIQRHPNSRWVDDSYILVGISRFYDMEFGKAIETFKYVNTHSEEKNERHQALVALMRTFIEFEELRNAEAVSDYLKREPLNKTNLRNLYLTRAYLYQKREDYNSMLKNLIIAEPLLKKGDQAARIYFLMGQLYQQLAFEAEAYNNYKQCLKLNPPYELSFYAKLNMAQVTQLSNSGDLKKARKYFKKLLKDEKNLEYKDKIYYEMGNFEMKQDNVEAAIMEYKNSVESSTNNQRQKAYSYWRLSEIYYDNLKNFKLSKSYYDSTAATMPKDEEAYEAIVARQEILTEFVENLEIVEKNDSLLHLASLDTASLNKFLDDYIQQQIAEASEKKRKAKEREKSAQRFSLNQNDQAGLISTKSEGAIWYFYNNSAVSQGNSEFVRRWGSRTLEDNWRRSTKGLSAGNDPSLAKVEKADAEKVAAAEDEEEMDPIAQREAYIATIPYSSEQQQKLLDEVEVALFNLGNIYYFKLEEKQSSAETFEILLARFPDTDYAPEVMYELYLSYQKLDRLPESDFHKNNLVTRFPNSIYAKLIENPNYREESRAISSKLKKIYENCYRQFQRGDYNAALSKLNETIKEYPESDFTDNLELLRILIIGKTNDLYRYQFELNNFVKQYSESELKPYAETLIKASEEFQNDLQNSARSKFVKDFEQNHFFVLLYTPKEKMAEILPEKFEAFSKENFPEKKLTIGNLILNKEYSMILVNQFEMREDAMAFYNKFIEDATFLEEYGSAKFHNFAITTDNFNIFYQTKDFDAYKRFFRSNYLSDFNID